MTDEKSKHLDYIQNVISRMADNSFKIKGWMITIVSMILTIGFAKENMLYLIICAFPIFIFWGLDAYYLQLERIFRKLYNDVVNDNCDSLSMNINKYTKKKFCEYIHVLFSNSVWPLYSVSILITVALIVIPLFK